jgi:D-alanyl-D-alanine carboxypeptidase (penicillin-binding protein 5/6)
VRSIENRNKLIEGNQFATGVKTGHTQGAGWVLVGSFNKRGLSLITVVLGTPSEEPG